MSDEKDDKPTPEITAMTLRPGMSEENKQPSKPRTAPLPPRYSESLVRAIVKSVASGNYPDTAAVACGLPLREFNAWKRQVEAGTAHPKLVEFMDAMAQGAAYQEAEIVSELSGMATDEAGNRIPMSADMKLKMLERRKANNWSPAERQLEEAMANTMLNCLQQRLSPAAYADVLNALSGMAVLK